jgi:sterol desaturase/sphingolipid hydroxylase (fatty acid hydroxylase superfamily)
MHPNLISLAVPVFFAAIVAEAAADRVRQKRAYRLGCAISDLNVGIASQIAELFLKGIGLFVYAAVYEHRLVTLPEGSIWPWVVGLVGIDFVYYWWHRASHVVNVLWAVHAVHHQSEDMNFAVALRQPAFEALTIIPFHLPLALLGVEPWIYVSCYAIDLIYQFWVHTELTRRHPSLEWILNTPSAHRVHHGINAQYLDKNYGGILLVWDRLFGTYEPEVEAPVYGVTHALSSYNPIWANFSPFVDIARKMKGAPRGAKLGVWFAHPGRSAGPAASVRRETWNKYDPRPSARVNGYVLAHFALLALAAGAFLSFAETLALASVAVPGAIVLASVLALAAWTERRPWALAVDLLRQAATVAVVAFTVATRATPTLAMGAAAAIVIVFAALYVAFRPRSG